MSCTLQDFLGDDFIDRDTRSAAEIAASVAAAIAICERERFSYQNYGDFILVMDEEGVPAFWEAEPGEDMSRALVGDLNIETDNTKRQDLQGCPLASLGDTSIRSTQPFKFTGTLQHVAMRLEIRNPRQIIDLDNLPTAESYELAYSDDHESDYDLMACPKQELPRRVALLKKSLPLLSVRPTPTISPSRLDA